jgi:multisubunit Na+/H+ antiporter MnhB subunit
MRTVIAFATLLVLAATMIYVVHHERGLKFGEPAASDMDDYFIAHGQEQTGTNNIVTSVVFDFRSFDTLGEATVLFTAVLGVGILFRKLSQEEEDS